MINPSSREKIDFWAKEEDRQGKQDYDDQTVLFAQSRSRKWPAFRNPRIVPASRSIAGGKDRHSKVCTIRGLRDRRIRLSVATAVQIYDLQHKLGLSQPSKVVDWLLQVTTNDIDKLPPLGGFPYSPNFMNNFPLFELRQGSVREAMFSDQSSYIWEDGDYLSEVERPNNAQESNVSGRAVGNFLVPTMMSNFSLNNMSDQFGIMSQAVHQNLFINNDTSSSVSGLSHTQLCFSQPRPLVPPVLPPYATAAARSLVAENNLQPLLGFQLTRPPLKPVPLDGENLKVVWGENRVQSNYKVQNQGSNYICESK